MIMVMTMTMMMTVITTVMMGTLVMKQIECSDNSEDYTNLMSDIDFPVDDEDEQDANSENDSSSGKDESEELFTGSEED